MNKDDVIYVAGHNGLVGSAIVRALRSSGYDNLILVNKRELNLLNQYDVYKFFKLYKPDYVFNCAAKVGGIHSNDTYPANFIYENLTIQTNLIHSAYENGVTKFCFLGSSCIYPKLCPQPIKEEYLLSGSLEPTNEWYAIAKIAGIKMCQAYRKQYGFDAISLMPTNLYGIGDNFHPENSHVLPALIRRFHEAKVSGQESVSIWGTGSPRREFLYVDDMADAALHLMKNYSEKEIVNVGTGEDISILDLAHLVSDIVGFNGKILTDPSKPDGTPQKLLDVTKLNNLGWKAKVSLSDGIKTTYDWYIHNTK